MARPRGHAIIWNTKKSVINSIFYPYFYFNYTHLRIEKFKAKVFTFQHTNMNAANHQLGRAEKALKDIQKEDENQLVVSYLTLRKLIGWCGILLPPMLWLVWHKNECFHTFEGSISDYYYTPAGDIFVIILSALGLFLFTYNGYERLEKILLKTAAVCAVLVPLVPTNPKCGKDGVICTVCVKAIHNINDRGFLGIYITDNWHLIFALIFLFCLAVISIKYFTKSHDPILVKRNGKLTQKGKRNVLYRVCGWIIIASLIILGILIGAEKINGYPVFPGVPVIFIFETISVWAFGLSWLTKGQTLLLFPDKPEERIYKSNQRFQV